MGNPAFDYRSLSVSDRLQLVGDIWDSIAEEANATPDVLPLTDDQKAELDRRVAEYDADPSIGVPMDEVLGRKLTSAVCPRSRRSATGPGSSISLRVDFS